MSEIGFAAPPTSRANLRLAAKKFRKNLSLDEDPFFPVVEVLEHVIPHLTGYEFEVMDEEIMGIDHGLTLIDQKRVWLREDVYNRAVDHEGRDRMTTAHEIGHVLIHGEVTLPRRMNQKIQTFEDPEWQAKCFAGELLVYFELVTPDMTSEDIASTFGVSIDAADYQRQMLIKDGLL